MIIALLPRSARVIGIGGALVLAAACGAGSVSAPSTGTGVPARASSAAPSPAQTLTVSEAERIYARYARLYRKIYSVKGKGLEKILSKLALEISRADYRLAQLEGWKPSDSGRVAAVEVTIARVPVGHARWFVATLTYANARTARTHLIFQEGPSGAGEMEGWRVVAGSTAAAGQALPRVARNGDGVAEALAEDVEGLVATPRQVAEAHATWISHLDGETGSGRVLAADGYTKDAVTDRRAERAKLRGQWTLRMQTSNPGTVYALRTQDGGALVWYALREQHTYSVAVPGAGQISFSKRGPRLLSAGRQYTHTAQVRFAGWFSAVVPSKSAATKAMVVGDWYSALSVRGS